MENIEKLVKLTPEFMRDETKKSLGSLNYYDELKKLKLLKEVETIDMLISDQKNLYLRYSQFCKETDIPIEDLKKEYKEIMEKYDLK